jgi:AmmeMemoRadiSam system protein A
MDFQQEAIAAVRQTLEDKLNGKAIRKIAFNDPKFKEKYGVFVTLKKNGDLRGCIGFVRGFEPLGCAIQEMAIAAATQDPRFSPVTFPELKDIKIEISVLSPMVEVTDLEEILVGRDGLMLQLGGHSGLLLPQVATEWNWNRNEFLANLCIKAGLQPGSHLDPKARLLSFSAEVFGED